MSSKESPAPLYPFKIDPPLLNSSNPWATTSEDLLALYSSPFTGAVTIRTSLWEGFNQHPTTHQYTFFSSITGKSTASVSTSGLEGRSDVRPGETSSLNTLGYSPIAFPSYVSMLVRLSQEGLLNSTSASGPKPFIVSVSGTSKEVGECAAHLGYVLNQPDDAYPSPDGKQSRGLRLMMEINLSCPNIPDKPPPAYDGKSLAEYIAAVGEAHKKGSAHWLPLHVGIKTPPYTYQGQFETLIEALEESTKMEGGCPISFITATNTLGSCLVVNSRHEPALGSVNGMGIGGMAGDALHPLALGNVKTIRTMLDASPYPSVKNISIIGIGGVSDAAGFLRMKSVGAAAVGVGTALGREGVEIFEKITSELPKDLTI